MAYLLCKYGLNTQWFSQFLVLWIVDCDRCFTIPSYPIRIRLFSSKYKATAISIGPEHGGVTGERLNLAHFKFIKFAALNV